MKTKPVFSMFEPSSRTDSIGILLEALENGSLQSHLQEIEDKKFMLIEKKLSQQLSKLLSSPPQKLESIKDQILTLVSEINTRIHELQSYNSFCYYKQVLNKFVQVFGRQPDILFSDRHRKKKPDRLQSKQPVEFTQEINAQIQKLLNKEEFKLPNLTFLCCSEFFVKGWKLSWNAFDGNLMVLPFDKLYNGSWVSKILCGAMNLAKSSIFMTGVDAKNLKVEGKKVQPIQLKKIKRIFEESSDKIQPKNDKNFFRIDFVPVKDDLQSSKKSDSYVIRMITFPFLPKAVSYVSDFQKGFHKSYKIYQLKDVQAQEIEPEPVEKLKIYKSIHFKYQFDKSNKPIHDYSSCQKPQEYQKLNEQMDKQEIDGYILPPVTSQVNIEFRFQSLLLVGSEKKVGIIGQFLKELEVYEYKNICKPAFPQIKKSIGREIWVITHQDEFEHLEAVKKQVQHHEILSFFSGSKALQYKNSQKVEKMIKKFLRDYPFDELPKLVKGKTPKKEGGGQSEVYFMLFNYMNQSIFSFVYLDILEVRTSFAKEYHVKGEEIDPQVYSKS